MGFLQGFENKSQSLWRSAIRNAALDARAVRSMNLIYMNDCMKRLF